MASHDPFNNGPQGDHLGNASLVDKLIGTAYGTVRRVADHLSYIKFVAMNMETIVAAANNRLTATAVGTTAASRGVPVTVALPAGVSLANITSSTILITGSDGNLYLSDSGYFTYQISASGLTLTVSTSAPTALVNAAFRWALTYGG